MGGEHTGDDYAGPEHRSWLGLGSTVASVLLVVSVAFVAVSTLRALDDRQAATHAVNLQLASLAVAVADAAPTPPDPVARAELVPLVQALQGDNARALEGLAPPERAEAQELLLAIAGCGVILITPDAADHELHDHDRLQELLRLASRAAADDAAAAERAALLAAAVAVASLGGVVWFFVRSRYRLAGEREVKAAQARAGRRLERLLNDTPDVFLVLDGAGLMTYRSASAIEVFGEGAETRSNLLEAAPQARRSDLDAHLQRPGVGGVAEVFELTDANGEHGWFDVRVSDLSDDELVAGHPVTARNITREVQLRGDLSRQARTDLLTGLSNRRALEPTLSAAAEAITSNEEALGFLSLDLDGFKGVNDTLGHHAGDQLLVLVTERLRRALRPGDELLRLGGDEFAVVLGPVAGPEQADEVAHRLLAALDDPFTIGPCVEHVTMSIGIAVTYDVDHAPALVGEADIAMYEAKRAGGNAVALFAPAMEARATATVRINRALRTADFDREFSLVYQPILTADGREVVSYEALLRWDSPTLGPVAADRFIPVAEASGEICRIGDWVIDTVCEQLASWRADGLDPEIAVSFNVSAHQLAEPVFVSKVLASAMVWGIRPDRLIIEVTESVVLDHAPVVRERLQELRRAGVRISIDDFGSGYSNLGQLLFVPFDILKIDRSLLLTLSGTRAGDGSPDSCVIMRAIVSIAGVFHAPVVCEGVETEAQRKLVQSSGVSHIQGYLTGRPGPSDGVVALAKRLPMPID